MIVITGIIVTLISGKSPDLNSTPCHNERSSEATITIRLPNGPFNFRNPGFEYYIPTPDLRTSSSNHIPARWLTETNNFYCMVTVTAPNCPTWSWEGALAPENRTNHNMKIKMPHPTYIATVQVEYYETGEVQGGLQFNQPRPGDYFNSPTRVKYVGTININGGRKTADIVNMRAERTITTQFTVNLDGFNHDPRYKGTINPDLLGINQLIEQNK